MLFVFYEDDEGDEDDEGEGDRSYRKLAELVLLISEHL